MKLKDIKKYVKGTLKGMGAGLIAYILIALVNQLGLLATTTINGYAIETVAMWVIFLVVTLTEVVE